MKPQENLASLWRPDGNDARLAFARKILSRIQQENREIDRFIERLSSALAEMTDVPNQPGQVVASHAGGTVRRTKDA